MSEDKYPQTQLFQGGLCQDVQGSKAILLWLEYIFWYIAFRKFTEIYLQCP